ncbi:MAG: ABC transporter ATP-binding protein [Clostridia bacterium]
MDNPQIEIKNLSKVYAMGKERVIALKKVNLVFEEGKVYCIVGKSGSGKSTLLNMMAGLEKPTQGEVIYYGKHHIEKMGEGRLSKFRRENIGFVFQSYNLMGQLTALENVAMPLIFKGYSRSIRNKAAKLMLRQVGLGERIKHKPSQMSGGQQQRVSVARAFVSRPKIVFADEPTGNLDSKTSIEVMELITKIARANGQTLILVSHDQETADYADTVISFLDGKVLEIKHNDKKMGD